MEVPGLGRLLRWRYARPLLQAPLLIVSMVMILHGLFGPTLAPKNLATTLSWLHFRGVLVLVLLCAGIFSVWLALSCWYARRHGASSSLGSTGRGRCVTSGFRSPCSS